MKCSGTDEIAPWHTEIAKALDQTCSRVARESDNQDPSRVCTFLKKSLDSPFEGV